MLKSFLTDHGETADAAAKAGGGTLTLYALLSGVWSFGTLGAAAMAFSGAVSGLKKLQEIADGSCMAGKSNREKYRLLLSLAAREAYLSAAVAEIPRTLKAYEQKDLPSFGTEAELEDWDPDLDASTSTSLAEQAQPVFAFLESRLRILLARAEVPDSERDRCCGKIRKNAMEEMTLIIAGNPKRFGTVAAAHILRAADCTMAANTGRNAATFETDTAAPLPTLEREESGFIRAAEAVPTVPTTKLSKVSTPAPTLTGKLKVLYEDRFLKARQELESGSSVVSAKLFGELASELRTLAEEELLPLLVRCLHNQGVSLYNINRRLDAAACFEEGLTYPQQTSRTKLGRFFAPYCREDFSKALKEVRAVIAEHPEETTYYVHQAECLWRLAREGEALALLESHPSEVESYFTLLSQLQAAYGQFEQAKATAETGLKTAPESAQLRMAVLFSETKPLFDRLHRERQTRKFISKEDEQLLGRALVGYQKIVDEAKRDGLQIIEAEAAGMAGNILMALGQPKKAVDWFDRALALTPSSETILSNKYLALVRQGDTGAARKFAEEAAGVFGTGESLGRQAAAWLEEGEAGVAADLLDKAFGTNPTFKEDSTLRVIWLQALAIAKRSEAKAETLAFAAAAGRSGRDLISAAEILESLGEKANVDKLIAQAEAAAGLGTEDGLLVRTVAGMIYYRRDAWGEAIRRLGTNGMDPVESEHVTQIIVCLINLDDVAGAIDLAERMIVLNRGTPAIERALAHCYLRIGREEAAAPLLARIVERDGGFEDRLSLFHVTQRLRPLRSALPILEEAVKAFPERMEGHLFLSGVYYVLRQYPLSLTEAREAQRLAPDHPHVIRHFARFIPNTFPAKLLNESDKAMIRKALADRQIFTPIEMTVKDGQPDITPLLVQLRQRQDQVTQVMEQYRRLRLPLCFVANILGEKTFTLWWAFSRGTNERLFLARGNAAEQQEENATCGRKDCVLDATALFTLAELGLLDLPGKCFEQIHVDTGTLAQLKLELTALGVQPETQQTAHYHEGKLVLRETDASDHRERVSRLTEIVAFLHDNTCVRVHGPGTTAWAEFKGNKEAQAMAEVMPDGAFGPALVAKSKDAAYYCDDEGLRRMCLKQFKVGGFSTQALLRRAVAEGTLDNWAYDSAVTTLLRRNYTFVSVDRGFILGHLRREKFVRDRVMDRLLAEIGSTTFGKMTGAFELGVVAGSIWFNTYTVGTPERADWLKPIAQAVAGLPKDNSPLLYFGLGLLVELLRFPALFIGILDMLIYEAGLSAKVSRSLRMIRYQIINHIMKHSVGGDPVIADLWVRAFNEAVRWREESGIKRRF